MLFFAINVVSYYRMSNDEKYAHQKDDDYADEVETANSVSIRFSSNLTSRTELHTQMRKAKKKESHNRQVTHTQTYNILLNLHKDTHKSTMSLYPSKIHHIHSQTQRRDIKTLLLRVLFSSSNFNNIGKDFKDVRICVGMEGGREGQTVTSTLVTLISRDNVSC